MSPGSAEQVGTATSRNTSTTDKYRAHGRILTPVL
jgi:hypothetical protein